MSQRSAALAEEFSSSSFMSGSRTPLTDSVPDYLAQATLIAPVQQNCSHPSASSPYSHILSGLLLCYSFLDDLSFVNTTAVDESEFSPTPAVAGVLIL